MDDLSAFLSARLNEDEAAATAASASPQFGRPSAPAPNWSRRHPDWVYDDEDDEPGSAVFGDDGEVIVYDEGKPTPEQADHIARHDPARVLREVEAKRQILNWYAGLDAEYDYGTFPDDVIGALAAAWSDHPDYRAEWTA